MNFMKIIKINLKKFEKEGTFNSNMLQADIPCLLLYLVQLLDYLNLNAVGGSCPGIGVCINKINQKVTVMGGQV